MEQTEKNSNVNDLMYVIKEDYKAKAHNKWVAIMLFILLALSLFFGVKDATSFMDYLGNDGSLVFLFIILLISVFKNSHFYGKIGASENANELLTAYDRNRDTDKYLVALVVVLYSLYFYFKEGLVLSCFVSIGVILAVAILVFILFKDNNVERLRKLVAQEEGKK